MRTREHRTGGRIPEGRDEVLMNHTSEGVAVSDRIAARRARRLLPRFAAVLLAAGALAACEGDNLFSGDGPTFQPRILSIAMPDAVFAEDTVRVRVDAVAAREVRQVIVSVRGAATLDTVITVDEPQQQISQIVAVPIPAVLQDTLLIVEAKVSDALGAVSASRIAVAPAFGPPVIQSVSTPLAVRPGENATLRITAFGARRISRIDVSARGAISKDTSIFVSPPQSSVTMDVTIQIPASVTDTIIDLTVTAQDESGFTSAPRVSELPFFIDPPVIQLLTPPSVQAGSPLNVQVAAHAIRQITQIRLELRGAVVKDTTVNIDPRQVDVTSFISIPIPGNITGTEIQIRAFAIDRAGSLTATPQQTVAVPSGSPIVLTVDVPAGAVGGHLVDVRVNATGSRPIKEIRFRWRGFIPDSLSTPETVVAINPSRLNVTTDVAVRVPCYADTRALLVLVTATDESEAVSPVASGTVTIAGNPECVAADEVDDEEALSKPRIGLPGISSAAGMPAFGEDVAGSFPLHSFAMAVDARTRRVRGRSRRARTVRT
jgi:hypothetical protein